MLEEKHRQQLLDLEEAMKSTWEAKSKVRKKNILLYIITNVKCFYYCYFVIIIICNVCYKISFLYYEIDKHYEIDVYQIVYH